MEGLETIRDGATTYAIVVRANFASENKYNFLTPDTYPLQLGISYYDDGEEIQRHYHPAKHSVTTSVHEFILVRTGSVKALIYDDQQQLFTTLILHQGDMILLVGGGHGFELLEDGSLLEVKQGPHDGEQDKVRF